jgi:ABC-type multidrug transport system fused ATPase/permease subunit
MCLIGKGTDLVNHKIYLKMLTEFHKMMLDKVTNAPINLYFDVTPTSRILAYFNSDLKAFDMSFIQSIMWIVLIMYSNVYVFYQTITLVPFLVIIFPLLAYQTTKDTIN